ncbi:MAG: rod shape-determining protein MreC [Gaiellaceae bacterium]
MPRNRTVRLAVLGNSVQRAASSGYPSSRSSALKRRIVVGVLVLLSLVLITLSFRSHALDGAQGAAAGALQPFEVAADRISRPFRDAIGYTRGLVDAKSENAKLRKEKQRLYQKLILDEGALQENVALKSALDYKGLPSVADFARVNATVSVNPQSALNQSLTITAGTDDGVRDRSIVIDPSSQALVGIVDKAFPRVSHVTLLTDSQSSVTAVDLAAPTAVGLVRRGGGGSDVLILDLVSKEKHISVGDSIITAGSLGTGKLPSMFPHGILIGTVKSQSINEINPFMNVQVQPLADFSSLQSVIVLVPPH